MKTSNRPEGTLRLSYDQLSCDGQIKISSLSLRAGFYFSFLKVGPLSFCSNKKRPQDDAIFQVQVVCGHVSYVNKHRGVSFLLRQTELESKKNLNKCTFLKSWKKDEILNSALLCTVRTTVDKVVSIEFLNLHWSSNQGNIRTDLEEKEILADMV